VATLSDRVKFCVLTGDLVDLSDSRPLDQAAREYEFLAEETRAFPTPLFFVPGNHDIAGVRAKDDWDPATPYYGYGFFTYRVGPLRWSFTCAGVHFVGLDFNRLVDGAWEWGVPDSAAQWLAADLALVKPNTRTLLFVHFPVGVDALREVAERFAVTQIFHGHDHVDRSGRFGSTPTLSSGSLAEIFGPRDRQPGYRLVHVTETGLETFYRATGARHAVTVDFPRHGDVLRPGDTIRGAFDDPTAQIEQLTVRIGAHKATVPFERGPLCCRFEAALDLGRVAAGIRPIHVVAQGKDACGQAELTALVLSGRHDPIALTEDVVVEIDVGGIDHAAELMVNDATRIPLSPTALKGDEDYPQPVQGTELRRIPLPRAKLRRLNRIELRAGANPAGGRDRFCVLDVRLTLDGRTVRDPRFRHGAQHPLYVANERGFWIDLTPGE
jgi:hypothetical protein